MRFHLPAVLALCAAAVSVRAEETYFVGHHNKFVNITFESNVDLETIVGTTNVATGEVVTDMAAGTGKVSIQVPVASLKTGIDMRDEHLRSEMWLDAAKHPEISFVSKSAKKGDKPNQVEVTGDFTLHGVAKEITVTVDWKELDAEAAKRAKFPEGKWLKFTTEFDVKLSDHSVKVPDMAAGKVADVVRVKMALFASTAALPKK